MSQLVNIVGLSSTRISCSSIFEGTIPHISHPLRENNTEVSITCFGGFSCVFRDKASLLFLTEILEVIIDFYLL
ncbi:unnamed protein product [Moneuplotes crassus]|uniref:Uncharacterized protein n=1 Tax=Euplotes crassus TaxID=5936 RepID=A0AAD2D9F5_EUPCR|nr:unnamed protein product [Moneuplotes crassus]